MNFKYNNKTFFANRNGPTIIAEISCNHNGKKSNFLNHIKSAKKAGADIIKIQTYRPEDIVLKNNFKIRSGIWKGMNLWKLYNKSQTPFEWHKDAFKLARKLKIPIFSSPFSIEAVKFLKKEFDPPFYKIASAEITDLKLINEIAKIKKPVLVSTGMATFKEIDNALKIIKKYHKKILLMHCVSGYPTPDHEANISFIHKLKIRYPKIPIGLSDHTNNIFSSLASVPLGIVAIEKHFILSKKLRSLDSKFSIDPNKLRELQESCKKIYNTLGKASKKNIKSEKETKKLRRSIFTTRFIKKNEKISLNNINTFRPKIGICASEYFNVIGKYAKKNLSPNNPLYWSNLKK